MYLMLLGRLAVVHGEPRKRKEYWLYGYICISPLVHQDADV